MRSVFTKLGIAVLLATSFSAQATVAELVSLDQGRYDWDGYHNPTRTDVTIGEYGHRNFFVFDLSGIDLTNVASVQFVSDFAYGEVASGYVGTYTMYNVTTPISELVAGGSDKLGIYDDLADGTVYGSRSFSDITVTYENFAVDFSAAGIAALKNANGGLFAFGGGFYSTDPAHNSVLFTDTEVTKLVFTYNVTTPVPEADTSAMMLIGLIAISAVGRRKK